MPQMSGDALGTDVLRQCLSSRALSLILMPTEQCNFRCVYCYEDFKLKSMDRSVRRGIKRLIESRASSLDHLGVGWFGGEPLAALPVVYDIAGFVSDLSESLPRLNYTSEMTTNGYLLRRSTAERLVDLGVRRYQITLDGYGADHDVTRVKHNGGATFDVIWNNLLSMREIDGDFQVILRLHYTKSDWRKLIKLLRSINDRFGDDPRFHVFLKPLQRLGSAYDDSIERMSFDENNEILQELHKLIPSEKIMSVREDSVCYAARANSFVIRSNGDVAKCTVAFSSPKNRVGHLSEEGELQVDQEKFRFWLRGVASGDVAQLKCPLSAA
jgi:uncharacterized protein